MIVYEFNIEIYLVTLLRISLLGEYSGNLKIYQLTQIHHFEFESTNPKVIVSFE